MPIRAVAGNNSPVAAFSAAVRRLERRKAQAPDLIEPAAKALDSALNAIEEARSYLERALAAADHDPAELERIEERLFALRAAGRKYAVPVDNLAALAAKQAADLELIDAGAERLVALEKAARAAREAFDAAAKKAVGQAQEGCGQTQQGSQWRTQAAEARTRKILGRYRGRPIRVRRASTASNSGCRPIPARCRDR